MPALALGSSRPLPSPTNRIDPKKRERGDDADREQTEPETTPADRDQAADQHHAPEPEPPRVAPGEEVAEHVAEPR